MAKAGKRKKRVLSREVAGDRLLRATGNWVEACGGSALVAGGIGVIHPGFGELKYNFTVCIKITGRAPKAEAI